MNQNNSAGLSGSLAEAELANPWVLVAKVGGANLHDFSLVLSAVGIAHQVDRRTGVILVRHSRSERAMFELRAFREENRNWPPPDVLSPPFVRTSSFPTLLMLGGLIFLHAITGPWLAANLWFQVGAVNSQAIVEQGQWWRLITALTLHADQGHLVGNCVIGGVMVHLLCKTIGSGTAWLSLLLSALLGNLLNIVLRTDPHYSVGFSTAVFAAIGIFCGRQLFGGSLIRHLVLPLGAGAGLLAMLGSGGEGHQTDLGAHLFGLLCGLVCGLLLRTTGLDQHGNRPKVQTMLFAAAIGLIAVCWLLAVGETGS
jgi:membrane associated rhomboid family serine protease